MSMERGSPGDGLIGGALIALNLILFVAGAINFGGGLFGLLLYIVVPACCALLAYVFLKNMPKPSPEQKLFVRAALLAAFPGFFLFGCLAGLLLCGVVALTARWLTAYSAAGFSREGYAAAIFSGACVVWLTLLAGMGAMAVLGALVVPYMGTADWLWANGLFGPFLSPVGAFLGASFATLPCLLIGAGLGVIARRKTSLQ